MPHAPRAVGDRIPALLAQHRTSRRGARGRWWAGRWKAQRSWPCWRRSAWQANIRTMIWVMSQQPIVAAVTTSSGATPAGCDRGALAELASLSLPVRAWLDAFDATVAR